MEAEARDRRSGRNLSRFLSTNALPYPTQRHFQTEITSTRKPAFMTAITTRSKTMQRTGRQDATDATGRGISPRLHLDDSEVIGGETTPSSQNDTPIPSPYTAAEKGVAQARARIIELYTEESRTGTHST
ncbi:hypothetical protein PYCC9005_004563 [Savitreella phatthalungensis]